MGNTDFLGKGLSFPVSFENGKMKMSQEEDLVRESIHIILSTERGERVMRPDFGANLSQIAFAPNNTATATLLSYSVREALELFEPRIEVIKVSASADAVEKNRLNINIEYRVLTHNSKENLVYPFYLQGAP